MFRKNRLTLMTGIVAAALVTGTPAAASSWTVDTSKSSLTFVATQNGSPVEGRFAGWNAEITLDPQAPETGRIRAVIDTASAATGQGPGRPDTGQRRLVRSGKPSRRDLRIRQHHSAWRQPL